MRVYCNICGEEMAITKKKKESYYFVPMGNNWKEDGFYWQKKYEDEDEFMFECSDKNCHQRITVTAPKEVRMTVIKNIFPSSWDENHPKTREVVVPAEKEEFFFRAKLLYVSGLLTEDEYHKECEKIEEEIKTWLDKHPPVEVIEIKKWYEFWK
jgi:hypothetical protein